jgi:hypothetical protein
VVSAELAGKRLELLKEAFPKIYRVGHLWSGLTGAAHFREIRLLPVPCGHSFNVWK